jgi:hypothetical protein
MLDFLACICNGVIVAKNVERDKGMKSLQLKEYSFENGCKFHFSWAIIFFPQMVYDYHGIP